MVDNGQYKIKILSNQVQYQWEGTIGNNSTLLSGFDRHNWNDRMYDAVRVGNRVFYVVGYQEGTAAQRYFDLTAPRISYDLYPRNQNGTGLVSHAVCSDGTTIYWGGYSSWSNFSGIFATKVSNPSEEVMFSTGTSYKAAAGRNYTSVIDRYDTPTVATFTYNGSLMFDLGINGGKANILSIHVSDGAGFNQLITNNYSSTEGKVTLQYYWNGKLPKGATVKITYRKYYYISGIAVQANGSYLFVARKNVNSLRVLNKSTGTLIHDLTIDRVDRLRIDGNGNMWMISKGGVVTKHTINADGTLSAATLTLSGISQAISLEVSLNNNTLVVGDGGTADNYKAFSVSTGQLLWVKGQDGGYANGPEVNYDKFMFHSTKEWRTDHDFWKVALCVFQEDGTIWLADWGNQRIVHYSPDRRQVLNEIINVGYNYSTQVRCVRSLSDGARTAVVIASYCLADPTARQYQSPDYR